MNQLRIFTFSSLFALLAGCHQTSPTTQAPRIISTQTFVVAESNQPNYVSLTGVVKPQLEVDLAAQITAPIKKLTKREGDTVRRGEVLVQLSSPALQANVSQAEASLTVAEHRQSAAEAEAILAADTLARYRQLREHHSATPHELEEVQEHNSAALAANQAAIAQVAAARAALVSQKAISADTVLRAPFDGVVTQRLADPGALAIPGAPIIHVQSIRRNEVQLSAPENLVASLRPGSSLPVETMNGSGTTEAIVTSLSPGGDEASHSFLIKASLPADAPWKTGTTVAVRFSVPTSGSLILVPETALVHQGGLDATVLINREHHAEVRYVTLGRNFGDSIEVVSGLHQGDRILLHGDLSLASDTAVVVP
ncbi:MAG TPA: efflux RND transporter periplasmic adaptor subunit [Acidobacteriaceae bacterium]|nr:efflux RND transporter periplasmic adaptor subunit [Acidobacteriaceae bacterium]